MIIPGVIELNRLIPGPCGGGLTNSLPQQPSVTPRWTLIQNGMANTCGNLRHRTLISKVIYRCIASNLYLHSSPWWPI